jgi:hypothetical protein
VLREARRGCTGRIRGATLASALCLSVLGAALAADPPVAGDGRDRKLTASSDLTRNEQSILSSDGPTTSLHADAGDDAIGIVGRRITLSGRSSTPAERVGYRWIQIEGPPIQPPLGTDDVLTFVPRSPGVYRFALVVAQDGRISEPAFARIIVADAREAAHAPAGIASPVTTEEIARRALGALEIGHASAEALASAFESIAGRIELYETYADILQGSTSRLQPLLPSDLGTRAAWNDRLFAPLTRRLIDEMKSLGLDLSGPDGLNVPLSVAQRSRLAVEFQAMARGFRSASLAKHRERDSEASLIDAADVKGSNEPAAFEIGRLFR